MTKEQMTLEILAKIHLVKNTLALRNVSVEDTEYLSAVLEEIADELLILTDGI